MGPFPEGKEGKGEPSPKTEPIFLDEENWRVLEITILIFHYAFHHGFGVSPFMAIGPNICIMLETIAEYKTV
jgi:hypothetical protein